MTLPYYIFAWSLALIGWLLVLHLGSSRIGRALKVIKQDEDAAGALGIDAPKYKIRSLMLTASYASLSGALYVHFLGLALPSSFSMFVSFEILMAVILGGLGTVYGVFLAGPLLKFLPELTNSAGNYKPIIFGLLFIIVPMYFTGGIAGLITSIWLKIQKMWPKKIPT
jgi:branched-chain amino acid transport system permease protein